MSPWGFIEADPLGRVDLHGMPTSSFSVHVEDAETETIVFHGRVEGGGRVRQTIRLRRR